ncbi:translocation/assembly module TamB domain-containing protein [Geminocystis sp.]|uniref:translocation/assembly module TamB domain-containing protein n=1 Tax=Geminocystis sp. TaxID=2664100 RepID=UPI0035946CE4
MINASDYPISENPEGNQEYQELVKCHNFWRWFIYLALVSLGGGLSYGWYFLTQKLIPMVEKPVSNYLSRPVKLGKIEAISLTGIRLGKSSIETTDNENDFLIAEGVEISLNPLKLLEKKVDLSITIINANGYLQQDKNNNWISLKLNKDNQNSSGWYFSVNNIEVKDSNLSIKRNNYLLPNLSTSSINKVEIPLGNIFFEKNQLFFDVRGKLVNGNNIQVNGLHKFSSGEWLLKINSENLATNTLNNFLILPVDINAGSVKGNVNLRFLENKLDDIQGDISFNQVNVKLPNFVDELKGSQGKVRFHNQEIKLEKINTNLGLINTDVNGFIHKNHQLNIQANTTKPLEIKNVLSSLKLNNSNLVTKGKVEGKINIIGDIHKPKIEVDIVNAGVTEVNQIPLDKVTANLEIYNHQLNIKNLNLLPIIGGEVTAKGNINLLGKKDDGFSIDWQGKNIEGEKLASIYQQELPINVGLISGNYNLSGNWQEFNQAKLTGFSTVELGGGKANISNLEINHDTWGGKVTLSGVKLTQLPNIDCQKIGCDNSLLNGEFLVSGSNNKIDVKNIDLKGNFDFNLAGGRVSLEKTRIKEGNWQTLMTAENLLFSQLPLINLNSLPSQMKGGKVNANLDIKGNVSQSEEINIQGKGKLNLPKGIININNFSLVKDDFIAQTKTMNFPLDNMGNNFRGDVSSEITLRGNINNLTAENLNLDGDLVFSKGISVIKQPLSANVSWDGKKLKVNQAISDGIQAKGIINYDTAKQTVKDINLGIIAKAINLEKLSLPSSLDLLNYQGLVDFQGNLQGNASQPKLAGNVIVNNFQLANLTFTTLTGSLTNSVGEGLNLQLNSQNETEADKFYLQLDSNNQPQFIDLQRKTTKIKGIKDNDNFNINAINIPLEKVTKNWLSYLPFEIKQIGGNLSGEVNINLTNYDFTSPNIIIEKPTVNNLQGDIFITQLSSSEGVIKIEEGKLNHQKNEYLFNGELQPFGENPQLKAKLDIKEGDIQNFLSSWQIFELKDIATGIQPREYGKAKDLYLDKNLSSPPLPLSNSEEKTLSSPLLPLTNSEEKTLPSPLLPLPNSEEKTLPSPPSASLMNKETKPLASIQGDENSLLNTLTFFRKIERQLKEIEISRINANLPPLENLQGKFRGSVDVNASGNEGVKAEFDLRGNNWLWGKYTGDSLQATGNYNNGLLTLLPVKIQSDNSILSLTGTFKPERISGEVKLSDFSVSQLKQIANLPDSLDIEGVINASIAISGSEEKPLARGNIDITNSSINGTKIDQTTASFGFRNSRIDFLANSNLTENTQPLTIIGSLPFQLFPNSLKPDNNDFKLTLNLTQDGFGLLSIFSANQLNWLDGKGNINLDIQGKYYQARNEITEIETQGIATLENGIIDGKILAGESITNINGEVLFNFSQLTIPNLTGNFSGGNIIIAGNLPLIENNFSQDALNISVDNLALDINNLYQGNANGIISISNSAIAPEIGGKIKLYNGEIKVKEEVTNKENNNENQKSILVMPSINNLQLILGENIIISQPPLLNLKAEGNIKINGNLNNLKPEGIISLNSGNLNLFTSQLKLANNYDNIAKFIPENGFIPYLDLQLEGRVTETSRYQLVDNSTPNEIQDISNSSLNTAQTIRIKANVKGWSNNLTNNIELSSSPQRSQGEIISLLGGGFFNNFAEGDSNIGLANLASAAVIGSVQGQLQKAFGFDQLRLFPTQILNPEKRTSSFALGGELGLDITDNLSISITKILTNEQDPQYSIRYRINDQTILRGSTDLQQDSRGVIEFQHRF